VIPASPGVCDSDPNYCNGHGTCSRDEGGCICEEAWVGDRCERPRTACDPDPCSGHGTCNITDGRCVFVHVLRVRGKVQGCAGVGGGRDFLLAWSMGSATGSNTSMDVQEQPLIAPCIGCTCLTTDVC
jgi:hypothetical protein